VSDVCPNCGAPYRRHFEGFHCGTALDKDTGQIVVSDLCADSVMKRKESEYRATLEEVLRVKNLDKGLRERIQSVLR